MLMIGRDMFLKVLEVSEEEGATAILGASSQQ
jgi:hypothetical protein